MQCFYRRREKRNSGYLYVSKRIAIGCPSDQSSALVMLSTIHRYTAAAASFAHDPRRPRGVLRARGGKSAPSAAVRERERKDWGFSSLSSTALRAAVAQRRGTTPSSWASNPSRQFATNGSEQPRSRRAAPHVRAQRPPRPAAAAVRSLRDRPRRWPFPRAKLDNGARVAARLTPD